jgi:tight adherence protein B
VSDYFIEKRRKELLEQFKDLLFNLATALSTKASMQEAIGDSKEKIMQIYGDKSVLYVELDYIYKKMMQEDDIEVLKDFARRARIDDIYDFVQIYASCKYTGANLIFAMNKAASVIIDKMTIEKEIFEMIRRKKYEGMVILLMPVIILFLLNISAADYVLILYTSIYGKLLMTAVLVSYVGIYELIERITKVRV